MSVKRVVLKIFFFLMVVMQTIVATAQTSQAPQSSNATDDLFKILRVKDSLLFDAVFTECNPNKVESLLTKEFVFYHDNGYSNQTRTQSLSRFIEKIKQLCESKSKGQGPEMRREIAHASLEVYPVGDNKAIQMGVQRFYMVIKGQQDQLIEESKFSRDWQKENGEWKIARELDYLQKTKFENSQDGSSSLYREIAHMDSVLFNAFNKRDIEGFKTLFTTDLEFYHDKGGLTDYNYSIQSLKNTAAQNNGLRRELVKGSLEVYPIKDYGAIQIGAHTFCHPENGQMDCGTFKFVHVWKKVNNEWKITRVISYDH